MCKMPGTDISTTFEHPTTTMRTETILLTVMSFVDMYQYTALGNSVMLLHSILIIHELVCLLVNINKINFLSQSSGNLRKNVKSNGVATILNTTEIGSIDAYKTRKISCLYTTLFTYFFNTIANSRSVLISCTATYSENSTTYAKTLGLTPDVINHLLFIIGEVLVKQSFKAGKFLFPGFFVNITTDWAKDCKHFSIWSSNFNLFSVYNLG